MRDIAFDCETWLIQPGRLAPRVVCLTYSDGDGDDGILTRDDAVAWFRAMLLDDDVRLWGANTAYDCGVLAQEDSTLLPLIFRAYDLDRIGDVQIDEMLRNIALGRHAFDPQVPNGGKPKYSLEELTLKYCGVALEGKHDETSWRFRYHELDGVPLVEWPRPAINYAMSDAIYTMRVHRLQVEKMRGGAAEMPTFWDNCRQAWGFHLEDAWGLRTDGAAVEQLQVDLHIIIDELMDDLTTKGFYKWKGTKKDPRRDGRSRDMTAIKQAVKAAYATNEETAGQPPLTKTGLARLKAGLPAREKDIATDEETLSESGDPDLETLAEVQVYVDLLTKFLPTLRKGTVLPINPRINILVESMRTSCRKPNIQQMPRKGGVRECYVPRPGWIYIGADFHVAELCSLSQVLLDAYGESSLADTIREGKDPHLMLGADLIGTSYDDIKARRKAGDKQADDARQLSKAANFGYPGGMGPAKFASAARKGYGLSLDFAASKHLKQAWQARYPEMRKFHGDVSEMLNASGGRIQAVVHPRTHYVRGDVGYCDTCNHFFQHLTAAGAKAALYEAQRECYIGITRTGEPSALFGCRIVAFVHDEIIAEAPLPLERARAAAKRLGDVMVEQMSRFTPDVPSRADAHMMRRWYKAADPVTDKDGNLIPWEPQAPALALAKALKQEGVKAKLARALDMETEEVDQLMQDGIEWDDSVLDAVVKATGDAREKWTTILRMWALEQAAQKRLGGPGHAPRLAVDA
uniref:Bifunctional 3'-5' exonuclease/DNA polymerase n=1 Tax=uncultured Caudovirales phage TaxID=2100421 RepID=A0A6J5L2Y5_9CAUD|nr:bifunctional 3'-5' exonuclease/DNA polymerase [uncultured Caudovirales phage]